MKKAEGKSPKSEVRGPKQQGATSCPASAFSLQPSAFTRIPWLLAAVLVLVTVVLYWPATRCGFLVVDDIDLTGNPYVLKGLTWESIKWPLFNLVDGGVVPIHTWSHMLAVQLFGLNPWGHHLINVLLHALNAALVFAWLQQMTGATWRSLMVAALFAVHPLRVEPVVWVTERRELLGAFFGLLSLIAYIRYVQGRMQEEEGRGQQPATRNTLHASRFTFHASRFYLLSVVFYGCGLMSKPNQITWPFVMLLLDYWPLRRFELATIWSQPSTILRLVREKIPLFVMVVLYSVQGMFTQRLGGNLEWGRDNPLGARLGNAVVSYGWYLRKLFWPADLAMFYPHPGYWPLGKVVLAGGVILGLSLVVWVGWRRHPYLLVGWLWYCGVLFPNSQVVQTWVLARADRWTYLPLLGVMIFVVWGACELTRRWRYRVLGLSLAGGVALVLCLALTRYQIGYWKDSETLLRHALAVSGDNEWPLSLLGAALDRKGRSDEAIHLYQTALRLKPNNSVVRNLLGIALSHKGQTDEAITQFQETIRLSPDYSEAHYNLGNTLLEKGQTDEAISEYQEALRRPLRLTLGDPNLHNNLGLALARKGRTDEAIIQYQEALRREPDDPDIHFNLGAALAQRGQMDEAIRHYEETLRRQPDRAEAHNNLGAALLQQGRAGEAIREFQEALRLKPGYADARKNLIVALAQASSSPPPGAATNR